MAFPGDKTNGGPKKHPGTPLWFDPYFGVGNSAKGVDLQKFGALGCKFEPIRSVNAWCIYMGVSKNRGTPQIIHFNRVFHYKVYPFGGTPIFGNTHIPTCIMVWLILMSHW